MKFIYTAGQFATFRGRMFAFKKATEITDKATIEALRKHPDFMEVSDEKKVEAPAAATVLNPDAKIYNSELNTLADWKPKRATLTAKGRR